MLKIPTLKKICLLCIPFLIAGIVYLSCHFYIAYKVKAAQQVITNYARSICYCDSVAVEFSSYMDSTTGKYFTDCDISFFEFDYRPERYESMMKEAGQWAPSIFRASMDNDTTTYRCISLAFKRSVSASQYQAFYYTAKQLYIPNQ